MADVNWHFFGLILICLAALLQSYAITVQNRVILSFTAGFSFALAFGMFFSGAYVLASAALISYVFQMHILRDTKKTKRIS